MTYSLIIAEDEQLMRKSLVKMIDWNELGYTVVDVFSDGSEVLEYLKKDIPEVLLMDINMIHVSGIEVAKFVWENKLPVHIVFLSGYKDFGYMQAALEYKVFNYLLKPISLPKFKQIFIKLHDELDNRTVLDDAMQYRMDRYNRLINYEKHQLILEAFIGILVDSQKLQQRLKLIGTDESGINNKSTSLHIRISADEAYNHFINDYGAQELTEQLIILLQSFDDRLEFYLLDSYYNNELTCLFLENGDGGSGFFEEHDETVMKVELEQMIKLMTGLTATVSSFYHFNNFIELTQYQSKDKKNMLKLNSEKESEYYHHLREQKKLILTYIMFGDYQATVQLFCDFIEFSMLQGVTFAQNQMTYFFSTIIEKISNGDADLANALLMLILVIQIPFLRTAVDMIKWGEKTIDGIIDFLSTHKMVSNGNDYISKIQQYVQKNYANDITLSDVADNIFLNPIYVSRIFKERTGKNFSEYLSEIRIEKATDYLKNTNLFVYEICDMVGYHDIKYFYKIFKKMKGCSPSEYREGR